MSWEFSEDAAFLALCDAYKESGEPSAMEFLAHGEGAFHFQELTQNAAGEGIDLSDSTASGGIPAGGDRYPRRDVQLNTASAKRLQL